MRKRPRAGLPGALHPDTKAQAAPVTVASDFR
jgi:hypothetical protein